MWSLHSSEILQCSLLIPHRFGTTYQSHLQGSRNLKERTQHKIPDIIFFYGTLSIIYLLKDTKCFRIWLLFPFSGMESPNLLEPLDWVISVTGYHRNTKLFRCVPENRSSPKVVAGRLKNYKLPTRLKNKTWTRSQIKTHKKNQKLCLNRPHTQHKNPEHISLNS
jgi:hypothetical protein